MDGAEITVESPPARGTPLTIVNPPCIDVGIVNGYFPAVDRRLRECRVEGVMHDQRLCAYIRTLHINLHASTLCYDSYVIDRLHYHIWAAVFEGANYK